VEGQDAGFPETVAGLPGWEPTRVVPTVVLGQISLRKKLRAGASEDIISDGE
jgi:hypothetical protein